MDDAAVSLNADKIRARANWLLGLGLALPLIAVSLQLVPQKAGAQLTGKNLFMVMLALSIAGLLNKKRSVDRKAHGRLLVAALCVMLAVTSVAAAALKGSRWGRSPQETALIASIHAATARQVAALDAIDQRMEAIALEEIMTPAALTSLDGIKASRATVGRFKEVADERIAQLRNAAKEYERLINEAGLDGAARVERLAEFKKKSAPSLKLVHKLYDAHYKTVVACVRLIDFAESRLGQIQVVNGELAFARDADLVAIGTVLEALRSALKRQEHAEAILATDQEPEAGEKPGFMRASGNARQ